VALPKLLLAAGGVIVVAALLWWWATFGDVIRYGYLSSGEATRCLIKDSDICTLAKALCLGSHPRTLVTYWTSAFWLGVGILSFSLLMPSRRQQAS
jgi:hypothetical protein